MKLLVLCALLSVQTAAFAECIATAYRTGLPIPAYVVRSTSTLTTLWNDYVGKYPEIAELTFAPPEYFPVRTLQNQCLVSFEVFQQQNLERSGNMESLIIQAPCSDFSPGELFRLYVYHYCIELFGRDPDFYSAVPFRHARVTDHETYFEDP